MGPTSQNQQLLGKFPRKIQSCFVGRRNAHKFWFVTVCEKIAPDFGLRLFPNGNSFLLLQNLYIILSELKTRQIKEQHVSLIAICLLLMIVVITSGDDDDDDGDDSGDDEDGDCDDDDICYLLSHQMMVAKLTLVASLLASNLTTVCAHQWWHHSINFF